MGKLERILGFTALMIATFLGTLDSTIVNIALPNITEYFKASINDISWISTIYVLSLSVFMITASKLADQFGRKKLLISGLLLFGLSSGLCGLSKSLPFLIVIRFIQGIGAAIITPIGLPIGLEILGKDKRQFVVGVAGAIISLAAASGPPLGGILVQYINWQAIFFINIPLCFIAIALTLFFVQESYDTTVSKSVDWAGVLLLTMSLLGLNFALLKASSYGWNSWLIITIFIGSAVTVGLFIWLEYHNPYPMLELELFKEITFTASSLCYMMVGFGLTSTMLIFNYFLENFLGYVPLKAAMIIIAISLTSMITVPMGSVIAKKLGTRLVNFLGVFLMGLGLLFLAGLDNTATKIMMIASMVVFGAGLGFAGQAIASAIKYLPPEKSGIASGVINAFRQVGACIGVAILVSVLNFNMVSAIRTIKADAVTEINCQTTISLPLKEALLSQLKVANSKNGFSQSQIQKQIAIQSHTYLGSSPSGLKPDVARKISHTQNTIYHILKNITADKNRKIAGAFDKVFLLSAILLILMSIWGLFTDKNFLLKGSYH